MISNSNDDESPNDGNPLNLADQILETIKSLSNEIKDENKKKTLQECHRLLQRPPYRLIPHPWSTNPRKRQPGSLSETLLTETLVITPRRIPLWPITDSIDELKDPRIKA